MEFPEKFALYSVLLRLIDDGTELTPLERRDLMNTVIRACSGMTADDILSATENNRKLRIKRGTTAQNDEYIGLSGEITIDTDTNTLRIHDGEIPGGHPVKGANDNESTLPENIDYVVAWQNPTTENNYTWYRKYASGWVEQGGISTGTQSRTVHLPIQMSNAKYVVLLTTDRDGQSGNSVQVGQVFSRTSTTLNLWCNYSDGSSAAGMSNPVFWEVSGVAA